MFNIGRHYKISSAIREIEKGKQFVCTFWKFRSAYRVNICSVNFERETTFFTLCAPPPPYSGEGYFEPQYQTSIREELHA